MKKIMFNDKFLLNKAVLNGTKTMTRRVIKKEIPIGSWQETEKMLRYKIGEVVAIAQCYLDIKKPQFDKFGHDVAGNTNKMFVRADLMPHHIKITDVRVERLQDISDDDCLQEGIIHLTALGIGGYGYITADGECCMCDTPREAFAELINNSCGKGTFERNLLVEAYTFTTVD
ncbi:hypothetical protein [Prevotella corporis]|jgi:hypothetical protein|uniref:hypothetical protein n=1 Tax=Prevotella corporis TaxID=28128 RepID=UPI0023F35DA1|nr:hypothetical protein [Prevotella corporis]